MATGFFKVPEPVNEPVLTYAPGSKERDELQNAIATARSMEIEVPMYIGGEEVRTDKKVAMSPPHDHKHILGYFNAGSAEHVEQAINAAMAAKEKWANLSWEHRASVFLKAADLISGPYRSKLNAATMLAQSKNPFQSEIDAVAELADFFRYNVKFMAEIYADQPESSAGIWNRVEHRPLEGFVFALTPFNFTSIAGNLPTAPAMMGNTIVWKPANSSIYTASLLMQIFIEAGLPAGVINLVYVSGPQAGEVIFNHRDFGGIHFTGSTGVFQHIWKTIGTNISNYKSYPRIVGETGGKDFIIAHKSADAKSVATAITRGAFEYQGQKCSAASRAYIPDTMWEEVKGYVLDDIKDFKVGGVEDFSNFFNAVIDEKAFDSICKYLDGAKSDDNAEILIGGGCDKSTGYFIEPTVILTKDPKYVTMCEEIFGPVITIYVYKSDEFEETLKLVDDTSPFALTGAVFSQDRYAAERASQVLVNSAGNFYINDKPTGAVVGQQPFGGARASGTNDKAGSKLNLQRWISQRTIKETFVPPTDYRYPFLG